MRSALLTDVLSVQYNIVNYGHNVEQKISGTYSTGRTETFLRPHCPGNHHSALYFDKLNYFRYFTKCISREARQYLSCDWVI